MTGDGEDLVLTLAGLIRGLRETAGLTQQQLAARAGVSVGSLRDLEQGRTTRPHRRSLDRLATALNLAAADRDALLARQPAAAETTAGADPGGQARLSARPATGPAGPAGGAGEVRLGILGPLAAWRAGKPVAPGSARQQALLALLALHLTAGVHRDAIVDMLWGEDPPESAVAMVHSQVSRLRRRLGGEVPAGPEGGILVSDGARYRLGPGVRSDAEEFAELMKRAGQAAGAGDVAGACELYDTAVRLWRGEPLAGVELLSGHPAVVELAWQRSAAVMGYAEAAAAAGWHHRVHGHLRALAAREPLNERAHALLMTALTASGQRAAALDVYEGLRRRLDEDLGVRPGPDLAEAHARALRHEAGSAVPTGRPSGPAAAAGQRGRPGTVLPRQLPPSGGQFAGRAAELAELTRMLERAHGAGVGTVVISAIGGTAGVGKTALALHWAHRVAGQFPDGQLFVNLCGYDPSQLVPPADALAAFLRALGVAGEDIPPGEDERAALYRSLLAGRRVLIVLDNARSVAQVRPLLPGSPGCVTLVTSRDALAGLIARDGARRVQLDLLSPAEAAGLLRALLDSRADAEPDVVAALAELCCRLPLALRVAAELALARPGVRLADLADELADHQHRLDLLDAADDPRTAMRAVFSWSFQHLDPDAAHAFQLLGLHPGPDFGPYSVAALSGVSLERARHLLGVLARAHLVQPAGPGRHGMHDLLRAYARELAAAHNGEQTRRAALTRLFDHYLHTAAVAMDTLYPPGDTGRRPRIPGSASPCPPVASTATARAWLDSERATLAAVAAHTAAEGWPGHTIRLSATLFRYLETGGYYPEIVALAGQAQRAARATGDRAAEAEALQGLIVVDLRKGRYPQATGHLQQALAVYRETGDSGGEARTLGNLGIAGFLQGRYPQATGFLHQALAVYRAAGNRIGEARQLNNLSLVALRMGDFQRAREHAGLAVAMCRDIGNGVNEAYALSNLGVAALRLGNFQRAREHLGQALAVCRDTGNRDCEAYALSHLGVADSRLGDFQRAREHLDQALAICRDISNQVSEAEALNCLGEVFLSAGRPGDAQAHQATALRLASQAGDRYEQARAHDGLARSYRETGQDGPACHHWQQALELFTNLGTPEARDVLGQLAAALGRPGASHA